MIMKPQRGEDAAVGHTVAAGLPDLKPYVFTKLSAEVTAEDVDRTISVLRHQQSNWAVVDRPSRKGDSVIIDYHAQHGERIFDGKAMRIELDGTDVIPGFESGLIGVSRGDKQPIVINFPEDHYQQDIAGKAVIFDIAVVRVEAVALPEADAVFVRNQGIESGSIEDLRAAIHHNMQLHLQKVIRMKNALSTLGEILKHHPVEVPQALVEEEVARLICDPCEQVEGVDSFKHDMDPSNFTNLAYNRMSRSLLATEIATANDIELDTAEVRARVEDLVSEYSDKERIIDWFYDDSTRLASIESDVLGEQVADWILQNMAVNHVTTSYSALMQLGDTA